jgi:hypothetical protein
MNGVLVSIILPNRNHAHYLPRAIDALLAQTLKEFDLVVVDDASNDNSLDVIARYVAHDPRVRVLALKEHRGVNHAVNTALESVRGEFVYVAGADDFVVPEFLDRSVAQLRKNREAGLTFSDPAEFHEDERGAQPFPLYLSKQAVFFDPQSLVSLFRRSYFHISSNTGIYRTSSFREAGGYVPELQWLSDWFVALVIALRRGGCYLPEQLAYLTVRPDSYSAQNLRDTRARRAVFKEAMSVLARPAYADVTQKMRQAALLPDYHLRTLIWLASTADGRKFMTPRLVARVIARHLWSFVRPIAPLAVRRRLRQRQSRENSALTRTGV